MPDLLRTRSSRSAVALALALSLIGSALQAKGTLNAIAKFRNTNMELLVDTYFDPDTKEQEKKAGLLTMHESTAAKQLRVRAR